LQDANYAQTSGYDADGLMTWADSKTWASQLSFGGFDEWRLVEGSATTCTGSCSSVSEVSSLVDRGYGDFVGVQSKFWVSAGGGIPYVFDTATGWQIAQSISQTNNPVYGAWALADRDIVTLGLTTVPIPAAAWLFGSALLGLGVMKRKKA
jgi:hypothetical protein